MSAAWSITLTSRNNTDADHQQGPGHHSDGHPGETRAPAEYRGRVRDRPRRRPHEEGRRAPRSAGTRPRADRAHAGPRHAEAHDRRDHASHPRLTTVAATLVDSNVV